MIVKPADMNRAYLKHFTFQASRYEEYVDGVCLSKGNCNTIVVSKPISHDCVAFNLVNEIPVKIWDHFELPVLGYAGGDVLKDRIQYGRLNTLKWHDPTEPIVCNIFNNMTCIRFATLSPLRIVEFYGEFTDIQNNSRTINNNKAEGVNMGRQCPWSKEELLKLYRKVDAYAKTLYILLCKQGDSDAGEALASYNLFKLPVVYVFIHYHYGKFEDLGMSNNDISAYIGLFMLDTRNFVENFLEGMREQNVFYYDRRNEIAPKLIEVCEEVLYIINH